MSNTPAFDHIAFAVPDLAQQVDRFVNELGFKVVQQMAQYALVEDPASGLKIEFNQVDGNEAYFRHLGFRTDDVDASHTTLLDAGMQTSAAPHRRDFARMYTSFLKEGNGLEVQLVKYD